MVKYRRMSNGVDPYWKLTRGERTSQQGGHEELLMIVSNLFYKRY